MPVFGSKQIKFVFKFCPLQTVQNIWNLPFCFIFNAKHPRRVRIRIRKNNPEPPHLKMPFFGGPLTLFYDQTTTTTTRRRYLCILCRNVSPYGISLPPLQTSYVLSPPTIKQLYFRCFPDQTVRIYRHMAPTFFKTFFYNPNSCMICSFRKNMLDRKWI